MKKFKVHVSQVLYGAIVVEAEDRDAAWSKIENNVDDLDIETTELGAVEVDEVEEHTEPEPSSLDITLN